MTYLVALLIVGFVLGYGIKAAWHHHKRGLVQFAHQSFSKAFGERLQLKAEVLSQVKAA